MSKTAEFFAGELQGILQVKVVFLKPGVPHFRE
jgi:hypothetical protein